VGGVEQLRRCLSFFDSEATEDEEECHYCRRRHRHHHHHHHHHHHLKNQFSHHRNYNSYPVNAVQVDHGCSSKLRTKHKNARYGQPAYLLVIKTAYTRWFEYDRDDLCVNKSQFVPVIFEPPCTYFPHIATTSLQKAFKVHKKIFFFTEI
jgi:hypothetical protein